MDNETLAFTPATQLAEMIRQKKLSPVELMAALLSRIDKLNPRVNAFAYLASDAAMDAARAAEAALMKNERIGRLHGIPVTIKDLAITKDMPTQMGSNIFAGTSSSTASTKEWIARLFSMLRVDRAPDVFNFLLAVSMVVTRQPASVGNKFDFQIVDVRLREVDDAQNTFVVQAVIGVQEQHMLFRGLSAQNLLHPRGQISCGNFLIGQNDLAVRREPLPFRWLEDAAAAGRNAQNQPRFCSLRGRGLSGGSRYVDVVALHQQRNNDHEDDQQHEHHVDQRRDVDLGLQTRIGIVSIELHNC